MTYFGWQNDDKKMPTADKIAGAVAKYKEKFGRQPTTLLCNPANVIDYPGLEVKAADYLRVNIFWLALEDD